MATANKSERIEFFLDIMCPYAYQTSIWIRDVREQTGLEVDWRFFSLEEINRTSGKPHPWEREWAYGWSMLRIAAWLRRKDMALVDTWYAAAGKALHEEGRQPFTREGAIEVAAEAGLPGETVDAAMSDPTTSDEVRADHDHVVNTFAAFGVPVIVFDPDSVDTAANDAGDDADSPNAHAIFGPVIVPAPRGDAAMRLWDLTKGWTEFPHLFEMRKPKTPYDWQHIGSTFTPYLEGRQWETVQNPVD